MTNYICPWCGITLRPKAGRLWDSRGIMICEQCRHYVNYRDDLTSPAEFDKFSPADQKTLLDWISRRLMPSKRPEAGIGSTYLIKQSLKCETGLYIYTDAMNGAMLRLGFKPIAFGDFSEFRIADRGHHHLNRLNELRAKTDQVEFTLTKRVDAKLIHTEAIKTLQIA